MAGWPQALARTRFSLSLRDAATATGRTLASALSHGVLAPGASTGARQRLIAWKLLIAASFRESPAAS
jgi:hypothetical protein